ncbi:MAG: rhodanese-like domain-containing protein [Nocardioides sp.]
MDRSTGSGRQLPTATVAGVPDPLPDGLLVLDVREQDEWDAGHVEDSLHVPLMTLGERFAEVGSGQVLVVCRTGHRSAHATAYLVDQGLDAVNLEGGLMAWQAAGRSLVTASGRPPQVV